VQASALAQKILYTHQFEFDEFIRDKSEYEANLTDETASKFTKCTFWKKREGGRGNRGKLNLP